MKYIFLYICSRSHGLTAGCTHCVQPPDHVGDTYGKCVALALCRNDADTAPYHFPIEVVMDSEASSYLK